MKLIDLIKDFAADEEGATAIEYGLIAALISAVIVGAVKTIGTDLKAAFDYIEGKLPGTYS